MMVLPSKLECQIVSSNTQLNWDYLYYKIRISLFEKEGIVVFSIGETQIHIHTKYGDLSI